MSETCRRPARPILPALRTLLLCIAVCFSLHASTSARASSPASACGGETACDFTSSDAATSTAALDAAELEAELAVQRDAHVCTIPRLSAATFTGREFFTRWFQRAPFILTNYSASGGGADSLDSIPADSFRARTSVEALLESHGNVVVQAAAGSTYSHIRRAIVLREYISQALRTPLRLDAGAEDSAYFFGDHDDPNQFSEKDWAEVERGASCQATMANSDEQGANDECASTQTARHVPVWATLLRHYPPPFFVLPQTLLNESATAAHAAAPSAAASGDAQTHRIAASPSAQRQLFDAGDAGGVAVEAASSASARSSFDFLRSSFGLGGHRSGVPFHFHGAALAEVLHGRKRWFLFPPNPIAESMGTKNMAEETQEAALPFPSFRPKLTQLQWMARMYPTLTPEQQPLQCTLGPGEILYVPSNWYHATINVGPMAVFLSSFVDEGRMLGVMRALGIDLDAWRAAGEGE